MERLWWIDCYYNSMDFQKHPYNQTGRAFFKWEAHERIQTHVGQPFYFTATKRFEGRVKRGIEVKREKNGFLQCSQIRQFVKNVVGEGGEGVVV